ncbi:MAG TPA: HAD family hydrolase [Candidatus Solibacter sp.]|jgi:Cof subfamily protein (haloacid dehalogenase superfamily)|nr:HAD family hydrolase [Candidatus Solibacter sp.]
MAEPPVERTASPGPFKALVLDIDGTLVDRSLEITPANLAALRTAMERGYRLILATGRMYYSALKYAEQIGTDEPVICYQGAVVRSRSGELLREWPVSPHDSIAAVEMAREQGLHINLYRDDVFYVESMEWGAQRYAEVAQMKPRLVPDLMDLAKLGSTKVVLVDRPERLRELEPLVRATVTPTSRVTFSLPEFLEIVDVGVSKGAALAFVCELEGLSLSEVIAAGDAPNDIEMFAVAGLALAPSNAFPEALAAADAVIPPPQEDGIAALVERYLGQPAADIIRRPG